ncbi:hypothetical protein [Melittangium boletus]|uniref:hypothetical protein n=1 Tax=Melittangium boletus TaxID=83453 RepID=UPI003DA423FF
MSADPQQLSQAIHDLIHDALTTAPPGGQPVMDAASTVLSLSIPGLPLDPTEFANPWTPLNPGGNPVTAENFAALVDAVPEVSTVYTPSGQSIEALYGQLVQANTPATPPLPMSASRGRLLQTLVETPASLRALDLRTAHEEAVTRYMSRLLQVDMNDPAEKQRWEASSADLKAQLQVTAQALKAEGAVSAVGSGQAEGQNTSVAALFSTARLNFELSTLGSMWGPGFTWHMTLAQPQNWFTPEASFFEVDLRTRRTLPLRGPGRIPPFTARTPLNTGLWGYQAQGRLLRRPVALESLDLRVQFKFARVALRRPWLDASLFSLGGWAMAGRPRLALSTGSLTGNTGIFPLLPTALIVARELRISAAWSQADVTFIRERLQQKDLTFGPFALSGQFQRPRARAPTLARATFDGVTLSAPDLQAIGQMSQLIPACPPLDG